MSYASKDIRPSLLDRLCDTADGRGSVVNYSIDDLRAAVQRDLQNLLNTRIRFLSPDESCDQIQDTLVNFGLPDMTTQSLATERGRREFAEWMERTIERFEPRFARVKVTIGEQRRERGRRGSARVRRGGLSFSVDALLIADPAPEDVSFDSRVDPVSQTITLREVHR